MTHDNHLAHRKSNSCTMWRNFPQFEINFMAKIHSEKAKQISGIFSGICSTHWSKMMFLLNNKQKEMALLFIDTSTNMNSTNSNVKTPSHLTLMLNHEEFVILLLQNRCIFECQGSRQENSYWRRLDKKQITSFKTMIAYTQFWN